MKYGVVVMSYENVIDAKKGSPTTMWKDHRQPQGYREVELAREGEGRKMPHLKRSGLKCWRPDQTQTVPLKELIDKVGMAYSWWPCILEGLYSLLHAKP